jgi:hypothetical protein
MNKKIILSIVSSLDKGGVERVATLYANEFAILGYRSVVFLYKNGTVSLRNQKYLLNIEIISDKDDLFDLLKKEIEFIFIHNNSVPNELLEILSNSNHDLVEYCVWSIPDLRFKPKFSLQLSEFAFYKYFKSNRYSKLKGITTPLIQPYCFELPELEEGFNKNTDKVVFGRIGQKSIAKWSFKYINIIKSTLEDNDNSEWLLVGCPPELIREIRKRLNYLLERITILDEVNDDNLLAQYYTSIDYFVAISDLGESFGLVLFEAISKGCYILTLSTPWLDNSQSEYIFLSGQGKVFTSLSQMRKFCKANSNLKYEFGLSEKTKLFLSAFQPNTLANELIILLNELKVNPKYDSLENKQTLTFVRRQLKYVEGYSFFFLSYWFFYLFFGNSSMLNKVYIKIWSKI